MTAKTSDSAFVTETKQRKNRIAEQITKYITNTSAGDQPVSLARFVTEEETFIVDNTLGTEADNLEKIWSTRFANIANELKVKRAANPKPDWGRVKTEVLKRLNGHCNQAIDSSALTKQTATHSSRSSTSKADSVELTPEAKKEFTDRFNSLDEGKKWKLSTGRCVENVMYEFAIERTHEHAAHSFILRVDDKCWKESFTEEELQEIISCGHPDLPDIDEEACQFFDTFTKSNLATSDSIEVLDNLIVKAMQIGPFDLRHQYDLYWLKSAMEQLLAYYRYDIIARLNVNISEMDLVVRYWSILDRCFDNIQVTTGRDRTSAAICQRLNQDRSVSGTSGVDGKKRASRPDLLLLKTGVEFGCSEVGKASDTGTATKKEIVETQLHSPKTMKDQFDVIAMEAGRDLAVTRALKIPCFHHTGLRMTLAVLDCPAGYVSRVMESDEYEIPLDPRQIVAQVLPIFMLTLQAKAIVRDSVKLLEQYKEKPKGITYLKALKKPIMPTICLPPTLSTFLPTTSQKRKYDEMS